MADKKVYEETEVLPADLTSNHNVRGAREDGTGSFKMIWTKFITYLGTLFAKKPISLNLDAAIALLDNTIEGQEYIINGLTGTALPTGVSKIRTFGIFSGTNVFNSSCEAFVTSLGRYVPCQYFDVATNKISCSYVLWSGRLTQASGGIPSIDVTLINISGETPTASVIGTGITKLQFSGGKLIGANNVKPYFVVSLVSSLDTQYVVNGYAIDSNNFQIDCAKLGVAFIDDTLVNTYMQIEVILTNL